MNIKLFRMGDWTFYASLAFAILWWLAPAQLPVVAYKLALVAIAAVLGYVMDRSLFPYARPHEFIGKELNTHHFFIAAGFMLRRALIVLLASLV